ncbi:MAG: hypothetical protein ACW96S_10795 [Promethearchaeota archaeon]|jgi:hypothetical protein
MPDEFEFKDYKSMEDYGKTVEGTKYLHSLYLKAVNHPIRREILNIVNEKKNDEAALNYNMDYLIKAFCVQKTKAENEEYYEITQSGRVVEYL